MASLIERYKQLLQPVGQKLSQVVSNSAQGYKNAFSAVGNKIDRDKSLAGVQVVPGGIKGGISRVTSRPAAYYNVLSPQSMDRARAGGQMIASRTNSPIVKAAVGAGDEFIKNYQSGFRNIGQGVKNRNIGQVGVGAFQTVRPSLALYGGGVKAALANAGVSGALSAAFEKYRGGDAAQAFGRGLTQGVNTSAVTRFTDPVIGRVAGYVAPKAGLLAKQLVQRGVAGVGNVAEDEILAGFDQYKNTNSDRALSLIIGAASAGNSDLLPRQLKEKIEAFVSGKAKSRLVDRSKQAKQLVKEVDTHLQTKVQPRDVKGRWAKQLEVKAKDPRLERMATIWGKSKGSLANVSAQMRKKFNDDVFDIVGGDPKKYTNFMSELKNSDPKWKQTPTGLLRLQNNDYAMGAVGGVELTEDENGKLQFSYSPEKGLAGAAFMGGVKAIKNLPTKGVEANPQSGSKELSQGLRSRSSRLANQLPQTKLQGEQSQNILKENTSSFVDIISSIESNQAKPFVSERDLPNIQTKQSVKNKVKDQASAVVSDFKEWEKQLFTQENAKLTPRAQSNKNVAEVARSVGKKLVPSYLGKESLSATKDISNIDIGMTDVNRNFDKVFGKNSKAHKEILLPFDKSKKQMVDDLDNLANDLEKNITKKFNFKKGSKESAAIQQYGEGLRNYATLVDEFGEKKAKQITDADGWFRSKYDQLLSEVNAVRKQIYPNDPTKIIPRRKDYYRHFTDLSDTFAGLKNIFDNPAGISPGLAGVSEYVKPKSKWLSFAQARIGNKTEEDAIGGFIEYAKAQTYAKNIDPHISKFRGLKDTIANAMEMSTNKSGLNNFIEFLDDFSNDLAGKTNPGDRALQKYIGRKPFKVINWLNNRTKANQIVGNVSSMVAQIFNVPQGIAEAGIPSSIKGVGRTVSSILDKNSPINKSLFVKTRYGDNSFDRFDTGLLNNSKKMASWMTGILDEVGTKYIWNSVYDKALSQKIQNPIEYADDITRKLVAGRGIGEVPLLQKSKVFQLIAPFQLEVANIWHVMKDWAGEKSAKKFIYFFVASHVMNNIAKEIRGSDVSIDPIQASIEAYQAFQEEENKGIGAMRAGGRLAGEVLSNIPLGQTLAATYPEYGFSVGDTKLPTRSDLFGEGDPTRFGGEVLVAKALQDPLYSILPSYGGKQIKKTLQGIKAYNRGYSETKSGAVRFPIENDATNQVKTGLFGEYGAKEARDYFDNEKKPLGESQTEIFKTLSKEQGKEYLDAIDQERAINRIFKELEDGNIDEQEAESLITKANASGEFSPLTDTKNKALREKLDSFTKKKIKLGLDVTEKELESAYLGTVSSLPSKSKYEKAIKDSKLYSLSSGIYGNEDLSESQKQLLNSKVASQIGIKPEDLEYYQVANDENNLKTIYVLEALQGQENVIPYLEQGRRKVNEKQLVSNGVIDNLVDEGLISEIEGKRLKKIDFDRNGKLKSSKGSAKKPKIITPEMPKIPTIKLSSPRVRKIKTRKAPEYKIRKIRLKSGLKKTKKLTLR